MGKVIFLTEISLLLFFTFVSNANSSDWKLIEKSDDVFHWVDFESVKVEGVFVNYWAKTVNDYGEERKIKQSINCREETVVFRAYVTYKRDGTVLNSLTAPEKDIKWWAIPPDSVINTFQNILCSNGKPSTQSDINSKYERLKPIIEKYVK